MNNLRILAQIRPKLVELIDTLDDLQQVPTDTGELTREDIIADIESYGVNLNKLQKINQLTDEQMMITSDGGSICRIGKELPTIRKT